MERWENIVIDLIVASTHKLSTPAYYVLTGCIIIYFLLVHMQFAAGRVCADRLLRPGCCRGSRVEPRLGPPPHQHHSSIRSQVGRALPNGPVVVHLRHWLSEDAGRQLDWSSVVYCAIVGVWIFLFVVRSMVNGPDLPPPFTFMEKFPAYYVVCFDQLFC